MINLTAEEKQILFDFFKDEKSTDPERFICIKCKYELIDSNNLLEIISMATSTYHRKKCGYA